MNDNGTLLLERREEVLNIAGREFTVKEMNAAQQMKYARRVESLRIGEIQENASDEEIDRILEKFEDDTSRLVQIILPDAETDFLKDNLCPRISKAVFEAQARVNSVQGESKNPAAGQVR